MASRESNPALTTIHQDASLRAKTAIECIEAMRDGAVVVNTGLNYLLILGGEIIRSGGNIKIIMIIDVVGTWCIGIPLCLLAAYVFKWGIIGVYTLLTTEEIFRLAVSLAIFRKRKWMISLS